MKKGFTLIEMMIVVAIIGILAASLGLGIYQNSLKKSRDGRRKADLEQMRSGLEMYRADVGSYPHPSLLFPCGRSLAFGGTTYITKIPCDPQGSNYTYVGGGTSYAITATLEIGDAYTVYNP